MSRRASGMIPPSLALGEAFDAVKKISAKGGGTLATASLATHMGYSPSSSGFRLKLANLKHFGLVVGEGDTITLTELGTKIASPTSENGLQIYFEPFLKIPIFEFLHTRFSNKVLPSDLDIKNLLIQEKKIDQTDAATWARRFLDSAEAAKLINSDGNKSILLPKPQESLGSNGNQPLIHTGSDQGHSGADQQRDRKENVGETVLLIALGDGKKAEIRFPLEITSKQIDKIIKTIEAQRPDDAN